jgi:thermitase
MSRTSRTMRVASLVFPVIMLLLVFALAEPTAVKLPGRASLLAKPVNAGTVKSPATVKNSGKQYKPGEIIIRYKDNVTQSYASQLTQSFGFKVKRQGQYLNYQVATLPSNLTVEEAVRKATKDPNVLYAQPNFIYHAFMFPNDPYFNDTTYYTTGGIDSGDSLMVMGFASQTGYQWIATYQPFLYALGMPDMTFLGSNFTKGVWSVAQGSGVKIAVLDTGVALDHEDLRGQILAGYDFVDKDATPYDSTTIGHGTHIAGIIAAVANNHKGIVGMAPKAKIIPIRVLDATGSGTEDVISDGIIAAAERYNADILNMSFGMSTTGPLYPPMMYEAVKRAQARGCHLVCAAGNDGIDFSAIGNTDYIFPAMFPGVIGVGSWDYEYDDNGNPIKVGYSNQGHHYRNGTDLIGVDVFAPGGDSNDSIPVVSTFPYLPSYPSADRYQGMEGTSMAAPHVSAYCALLMNRGITDRTSMMNAVFSTSYNPDTLVYGNVTADWGYGQIDPLYGMYDYEVIQGLQINGYTIADDSSLSAANNQNNVWDPGETIHLDITLLNSGNNIANSVYGIISTDDAYVTITQRASSFGNIPAGGTAVNTTAYVLSLGNVNIETGYTVRIILYATYDTGTGNTETVALPLDIPVSESGDFVSSGGVYHAIEFDRQNPEEAPYGGGMYRYFFDDNNTDDRTSSLMGRTENDTTPVGNSDGYLDLGESNVEFAPQLLNKTGTTFTVTNSAQTTSPFFANINIYQDSNPVGGLIRLTDTFEYYQSGTTGFSSDSTSSAVPYVGETSYPEFDYNLTARSLNVDTSEYNPDNGFGYAILEWDMNCYGNVTGQWLDRIPVTYSYESALAIDHIEIADANDNNIIEPGETVRMKVFIRNASNLPVTTAINCNLSTNGDPYVTLAVPVNNYNIPGVDSYPGTNTRKTTFSPKESGFEFTLSPATPQNHVIYFTLQINGQLDISSLDTAKDFQPTSTVWNCSFPVEVGELSLYDGNNSKYSIKIDDSYADVTTSAYNNNNGSINPGEMIKLNLSVWNRNYDKQLNGVRAYLSTYDANVKLVKNNVYIGKIGARAIASLPEDFQFYTPIDFSVNTIAFILTLLDDQGKQYISNFVVGVSKSYPPQVPGFPYNTGSPIRCAPTIADLDQDGIAEVLIGNEAGNINAIKLELPESGSAVSLSGWPVNAGGSPVREAVAVGDIDGSGTNSVVAVAENGNLYAWKADGTGWGNNGLLFDRTGKTYRLLSAPVLADIDGDGAKDIIVGGQNIDGINTWGLLYAFNYKGQSLGYFGTESTVMAGPISSAPAVGNISGDDKPEIVVVTEKGDMAVFDATGQKMIYKIDNPYPFTAPPVLMDMDNDSSLDIVAKASDGSLWAWNVNGSIIPGFPFYDAGGGMGSGSLVTPPAVGDLNEDNYAELLIGGTDKLEIITDITGTPSKTTIPVPGYYTNSQPAIADIDDDDLPEILISAQDGRLYAMKSDGTLIYRTPDHSFEDSAPAVGTFSNPYAYLINGESSNNAAVVGSRDGKVYAYIHFYESAAKAAYWPQFRHDKYHTGLYEQPEDTYTMAIRWSTDSRPYNGVFDYSNDIDWISFAGIAGHTYHISVLTPTGSTASPVVALHDSQGTQMTGFSASMQQTINTDGLYYVQVKNTNASSGKNATYQVVITDVTAITSAKIWEELAE